jgi:DNA phosphorothioation-dependent restriction protein DptG
VTQEKDYVYRRIVVEYGRLYAYIYVTDQDGKVLEEESFKQPFRLDFRDVKDEAKECFDNTYQWLQDTILWYATARDADESSDSKEPPEK